MTAALLATTVGCSSVATQDGWSRPDLPDAVPVFTASSTLPFEAFEQTRAEREQMQAGVARLLVECASGYALPVSFSGDYIKQVSDDPDSPIVYQWGGRLGTLSMEQANEYGYAAPADAPWQNGGGIYLSSPLNIAPVPAQDPVDTAKILGVVYGPDQAIVREGTGERPLAPEQMPLDGAGNPPAEGGCMALVEQRLDAPLVDTVDLQLDTLNLTFDDDRVKVANSEWVACMKEAGFDYQRFDEAMSTNVGATTPDQIKTAVADVRCTQDSAWPNVFYAVLGAYQDQAIEKQPELFQSALKAEQNRLQAAVSAAG